jgi:hypothetical protein
MSTEAYDYRDINDYAHMPDLDDAGARAYYKEIHFQNADVPDEVTTVETIQLINMMRKGRWRNKLAQVVGRRGDGEIEGNWIHTNALHFAAALVMMGVDPATLELRGDEERALILSPAYKQHARHLLSHYGIVNQSPPPSVPSMSYPIIDNAPRYAEERRLLAEERRRIADERAAVGRALREGPQTIATYPTLSPPASPSMPPLLSAIASLPAQAAKAVADLVAPAPAFDDSGLPSYATPAQLAAASTPGFVQFAADTPRGTAATTAVYDTPARDVDDEPSTPGGKLRSSQPPPVPRSLRTPRFDLDGDKRWDWEYWHNHVGNQYVEDDYEEYDDDALRQKYASEFARVPPSDWNRALIIAHLDRKAQREHERVQAMLRRQAAANIAREKKEYIATFGHEPPAGMSRAEIVERTQTAARPPPLRALKTVASAPAQAVKALADTVAPPPPVPPSPRAPLAPAPLLPGGWMRAIEGAEFRTPSDQLSPAPPPVPPSPRAPLAPAPLLPGGWMRAIEGAEFRTPSDQLSPAPPPVPPSPRAPLAPAPLLPGGWMRAIEGAEFRTPSDQLSPAPPPVPPSLRTPRVDGSAAGKDRETGWYGFYRRGTEPLRRGLPVGWLTEDMPLSPRATFASPVASVLALPAQLAQAVANTVAPAPLASTTTLINDGPPPPKQQKKKKCTPSKKTTERAKAKAKHDAFYKDKARGKAQDARKAAKKKFATAAKYKPNQGDFKGEKW